MNKSASLKPIISVIDEQHNCVNLHNSLSLSHGLFNEQSSKKIFTFTLFDSSEIRVLWKNLTMMIIARIVSKRKNLLYKMTQLQDEVVLCGISPPMKRLICYIPMSKIWDLKNVAFGWEPCSVWPDWAIYWTLGNFSKPVATMNLPKSPTFFSNFCKGVKILNYSSEIIFGQLL